MVICLILPIWIYFRNLTIYFIFGSKIYKIYTFLEIKHFSLCWIHRWLLNPTSSSDSIISDIWPRHEAWMKDMRKQASHFLPPIVSHLSVHPYTTSEDGAFHLHPVGFDPKTYCFINIRENEGLWKLLIPHKPSIHNEDHSIHHIQSLWAWVNECVSIIEHYWGLLLQVPSTGWHATAKTHLQT